MPDTARKDDMTDGSAGPTIAAIIVAFTGSDFDRVPELVRGGLDQGLEARSLLDDGLVPGIREVGELFRRGEVFLPEMMLAAEAWQAGMDVLEPHLAGDARSEPRGRVVIGTVKGDIHSLGKNIVATMLKTAGFDVVDLGTDVPASRFVTAARDARANVIAVCALMTTTMPQQREVIEHAIAAGTRDELFVMVGGASTSAAWAEEIGADGHGETAADAVALAEAHVARAGRS
jgi:corrinoid protein of di/trimethylamine methyltransferase